MDEKKKARLYILIGEKINKYRKNLSQEKLARQVNLNRSSITNIEKGRQHLTIDTLWLIATVLNVNPMELLPTVEEVKLEYDDIYLKQIELSESKKKWVKDIIEEGAFEDGKND